MKKYLVTAFVLGLMTIGSAAQAATLRLEAIVRTAQAAVAGEPVSWIVKDSAGVTVPGSVKNGVTNNSGYAGLVIPNIPSGSYTAIPTVRGIAYPKKVSGNISVIQYIQIKL